MGSLPCAICGLVRRSDGTRAQGYPKQEGSKGNPMKKLHRRAERFKGWTLGLDVHKSFIQYVVLDQAGNEREGESIKSGKKELGALVERLSAEVGSGRVQVVLEACGCFVWVYDLLVEKLGRQVVHVAAPGKVKVIAQSGEKTDATDAWWLAYLQWDGRLPKAFVAEGDLRELRIAWRERRSVVEQRSDLMRRLRSHLAQLGESLGKSVWASVKGRMEVQELVERLRKEAGMRGEAVGRLWERVQGLDQEVGYWHERMVEVGKRFEEVKVIDQEIPGIGPELACAVWSELGNPQRYVSAKAFAKASGLTPSYRESGGVRRGGRMTRAGNAGVRWALTRAVVACLHCQEGPGVAVKRWVEKRLGKKSKKATIVAAARKLAEGIWRLFKFGEAFDLGRAFGYPRAQAGAAGG
jgi:transposase